MSNYLKFLIIICALQLAGGVKAQKSSYCSEIIKLIANDWKKDSTSCLGLRQSHFRPLRHSVIDTVDKNFLFSKLGSPNKIQKFSQGGKNFIGYIYYVYKDNCPKVQLEAFAIQFIFDEFEKHLLEISDIDYCG
jgi:hypothetical protein